MNDVTYKQVLPHVAKKSDPFEHPPELRFYKPKRDAYIPIEFSGAAYRFGHSMVRQFYRLNKNNNPTIGGPFNILGDVKDDPSLDLRGFRSFPERLGN